jgi:CRISPR/Cas system-associated exonuclease Cas4 (RecB family)
MQRVKASDIANFNYCQRAFWYSIEGYKPENFEVVENGLVHHKKLAHQIYYSRIIKFIALGCGVLGILLLILEILIP